MIKIPLCEHCGKHLRYYNIGFDDGYTCDKCGALFEVYDDKGVRRDWEDEDRFHEQYYEKRN